MQLILTSVLFWFWKSQKIPIATAFPSQASCSWSCDIPVLTWVWYACDVWAGRATLALASALRSPQLYLREARNILCSPPMACILGKGVGSFPTSTQTRGCFLRMEQGRQKQVQCNPGPTCVTFCCFKASSAFRHFSDFPLSFSSSLWQGCEHQTLRQSENFVTEPYLTWPHGLLQRYFAYIRTSQTTVHSQQFEH